MKDRSRAVHSFFWLDLDDNQLTTLPPEIGRLSRLRRLDLRGNPLIALPSEVGQIPGLQEFYQLYLAGAFALNKLFVG